MKKIQFAAAHGSKILNKKYGGKQHSNPMEQMKQMTVLDTIDDEETVDISSSCGVSKHCSLMIAPTAVQMTIFISLSGR